MKGLVWIFASWMLAMFSCHLGEARLGDIAKIEEEGNEERDSRTLLSKRLTRRRLDVMSDLNDSTLASENWYSITNSVFDYLISDLPFGSEISMILDLFWPSSSSSTDLFSEMETAIQSMIDSSIIADDLDKLKSSLKLVEQYMTSYNSATLASTRSSIMTMMMVETDDCFAYIDESKYTYNYLTYAVALAPVHLQVYRERARFGYELYGSYDDQETWNQDLLDRIDQYQSYFETIYADWKTWRISQEISSSSKCANQKSYMKIKDAYTSQEWSWSNTWSSCKNKKAIPETTAAVYNRLTRDLIAEMIQAMTVTTRLYNFYPGYENRDPYLWHDDFKSFTLGPYFEATVTTKGFGYFDYTDSDNWSKYSTGTIDEVIIGKSVFALNMADGSQQTFGKRAAGTTTKVPDGMWATGIALDVNSGILGGQAHFSNSTHETTTDWYGPSSDTIVKAYVNNAWEFIGLNGYAKFQGAVYALELYFQWRGDTVDGVPDIDVTKNFTSTS